MAWTVMWSGDPLENPPPDDDDGDDDDDNDVVK